MVDREMIVEALAQESFQGLEMQEFMKKILVVHKTVLSLVV